VVGREALLAQHPDAVLEAASHDAVRFFSSHPGGIGGLDALKTACLAGVEGVSIQVARPPAAWREFSFVETLGVDLDRTRLKVVADPALTLNTHMILVTGRSGRFTVVLENVPSPDNPKTSWLACYSALAAVRSLGSRVRYGS